MPKLQLLYQERRFNLDKLTKHMEEHARATMREAARVFLRTIIPLIPVWTGEAVGSLAPIAAELHVAIPSSPNPDAPYSGFHLGMTQTVRNEPFITKEGPNKFSFVIGSTVPHFNINDRFDVSRWGIKLRHPTPWNAFEQASKAMTNYLRNRGLGDFPSLWDYFE